MLVLLVIGGEQPPSLDPRSDMKITDPAFYDLLSREQELEKRLAASPLHKLPERDGKATDRAL